jgi:hypothetical protein
MLQTLQQMRLEPAAQQEPPARKLVWTVAPTPNDSTDGFLRHRMSDPALEARPVKVRPGHVDACLAVCKPTTGPASQACMACSEQPVSYRARDGLSGTCTAFLFVVDM